MANLLLDREDISIIEIKEPSLIRWQSKGRHHAFSGLYIKYHEKGWWHSYTPRWANIRRIKEADKVRILDQLLEGERDV